MSSPPPLTAMLVEARAEKGRPHQQSRELGQLAQGLFRAGGSHPLLRPGFAGRLPGLAALALRPGSGREHGPAYLLARRPAVVRRTVVGLWATAVAGPCNPPPSR